MQTKKFHQEKLRDFYIQHLKENILSFWVPRCLDQEYGGFLNCFDNRGEKLLSHNKFTWSQGRFVWMFAKLANTPVDIFTDTERQTFREYAANGADFLRAHVLLEHKHACTYLMDRTGKSLYLNSVDKTYDASIYADFFVIYGFAKYSELCGDKEYFKFAFELYQSVVQRIQVNDYRVLPYVCPTGRRMHGVPMIRLNTATELWHASHSFTGEENSIQFFKREIENVMFDILDNFCDQNNLIHEIITQENQFTDDLLGRHINPGHSIEDLWFLSDAAKITGNEAANKRCCKILKKTLSIGWDDEFGGIYLYRDQTGMVPQGRVDKREENSDMVCRLNENWDSKLFWAHSESLYSVLRFYLQHNDEELWNWYLKIHEYTFSVFPNSDDSIGEWIQVRHRDGSENNIVVGLPVKDPFHITRNLIQVIELLDQ